MRRPFFAWLGDVFCALAAYTLSRWFWDYHLKPENGKPEGILAHLPEELATFVVLYLMLKLIFKAIGLSRRNKKAARDLAKSA